MKNPKPQTPNPNKVQGPKSKIFGNWVIGNYLKIVPHRYFSNLRYAGSRDGGRNWKLEIPRARRGFTLVEMLVSMSIFLIFTTVSLGIYTSTVRAEKKSIAIARVQQEAQFVMEFLGKMVRTSDIDYVAYPGAAIPASPPPLTQLFLRDANNTSYNFTYDAGASALMVSVNGGTASRISGANISITDLAYIITPSTSPYPCGGCAPTSQPRATIVMRFSGSAGGQSANLLVQQTIPQRSVGF
jgi:prepilin-type N-terminal cleavage/methylation domain-containing protein